MCDVMTEWDVDSDWPIGENRHTGQGGLLENWQIGEREDWWAGKFEHAVKDHLIWPLYQYFSM